MDSTNFRLEQQIEILINKSRVSAKTFKGKVIYISNHFITVQNEDRVKESFSFIDFSTGQFELKV